MKKKYRRIKYDPWISGTRKERNRSYIKMKGRVDKEIKTKGRLFWTDHYLNSKDTDGQEYVNENCAWIDLYFMSKQHRIFYNVALTTVNMTAYDEISQHEEIYKDDNKPTLFHTSTPSTVPGFKKWNLTPEAKGYFERTDARRKRFIEFVKEKCDVIIHDSITMDFNYRSGVGLHATLNVDNLTEENINEWIQKFWDNGETISPGSPIKITNEAIDHMFANELAMSTQAINIR